MNLRENNVYQKLTEYGYNDKNKQDNTTKQFPYLIDMFNNYNRYLKQTKHGGNPEIETFIFNFVDCICSYVIPNGGNFKWNYGLLNSTSDTSPYNLSNVDSPLFNNPVLLYITEADIDTKNSIYELLYKITKILKKPLSTISLEEKREISLFFTVLDELSKLLNFIADIGNKYGFLHNDLHHSNILYNNETGKLKIIDFGRSSFGKIIRHNIAKLNNEVLYYIRKLYLDKIYIGKDIDNDSNLISDLFTYYNCISGGKLYAYIICENEINNLLFIDLIPISLSLFTRFTEWYNSKALGYSNFNEIFEFVDLLRSFLEYNNFMQYIFHKKTIPEIFREYMKINDILNENRYKLNDLFKQILDSILFTNIIVYVNIIELRINNYNITTTSESFIINYQNKIFDSDVGGTYILYLVFDNFPSRQNVIKKINEIFTELDEEIKQYLKTHRIDSNLFKYYLGEVSGGTRLKKVKKYKKVHKYVKIDDFLNKLNKREKIMDIREIVGYKSNKNKKITKKKLKEITNSYIQIYNKKINI